MTGFEHTRKCAVGDWRPPLAEWGGGHRSGVPPDCGCQDAIQIWVSFAQIIPTRAIKNADSRTSTDQYILFGDKLWEFNLIRYCPDIWVLR